ncbi:prepilin-type N-terminal cleavage/methylation domain-containing protein [Candidatus Sumerlaeota bacterium]|nr:prepilin-type N-terminal cleavage/methylation domain-containing protein [Candidatus Sumerlaeota bacterium]
MRKEGFTLIELLIVVAIIAILAAIAVPNFLEAQARAKVSRAKNDLRTCNVGVDSYLVDENDIPPDQLSPDWGPWPRPASVTEETGAGLDLRLDPAYTAQNPERWRYRTYINWRRFTTPIAYITHVYIDPFSRVVPLAYETLRNPETNKRAICLMSAAGPDRGITPVGRRGSNTAFPRCIYDPSNGTVSSGDMFRPAALRDTGYAKEYYGEAFDLVSH